MFGYNDWQNLHKIFFFDGKMLGLKNENAGKIKGGGYTLKPIAS